MKTYIVIKSNMGLFAPVERIKKRSFRSALNWCFRNGYDLIEEA